MYGISRQLRMTAVLAFCLAGAALSDIPQVISYQGRLSDSDGVVVADGDYSMTFTIFDAAAGGTSLWSSGALTVTVTNGVFSVLLGQSTQPPITLAFDADYWLEVNIAGDVQTPRTRLGSVGYAFMASGLVPGTLIQGGVASGTYAAISGVNETTSGEAYGGRFESISTSGRAVNGYANATTGTTYGGRFISVSSSGRGVHGGATASSGLTYGVFGEAASTTAGRGVQGEATATAGTTYGVFGKSVSTAGTGVYGWVSATSGTTYGVFGTTASTAGRGVYGEALATSGYTYGGRFLSAAWYGTGVYGAASSTMDTGTYGGYFESASRQGTGVVGKATATTGNTYGGSFLTASTAGRAVIGHATATVGATWGVLGWSSSVDGVGVSGLCDATTGTTYGVIGGVSSPSGFAGYFNGRLLATESINTTATFSNHVGQIYNSSTGTSPDVLALKVGYTGNPGSAINYLTFFNGNNTAIGAVEGDGAGGVTFLSGSGDYAECLPRAGKGETMEPGDVVGLFDGKVTKRTEGADQVMVVSTRPIVVGSSPIEEKAGEFARVAFIGQVEVKVRGPVEPGDLLVPSGRGDGTAIGVSRSEISAAQFSKVFAQAWEANGDGAVKRVRAAVGLALHDPTGARFEAENRALREAVDALRERVATLEKSQ